MQEGGQAGKQGEAGRKLGRRLAMLAAATSLHAINRPRSITVGFDCWRSQESFALAGRANHTFGVRRSYLIQVSQSTLTLEASWRASR